MLALTPLVRPALEPGFVPAALWNRAYQALVAVGQEFASAQDSFRDAINERIRQGASAEGDLAQIESYIARANTRLAQFQRSKSQAEARFIEFTALFAAHADVAHLVVTFLALLELSREQLVSVAQAEPYAPIYAQLRVEAPFALAADSE